MPMREWSLWDFCHWMFPGYQFTGSKATFYILFALIYPLVIIDSKILDVYLYSWCVPICNCHAWLRAPRRSITRWSRKSSRALRMNSLWTRQGEQHRNVSVKVQKIYVPRHYSDFGRRKNVDWFCDSWNLLDAVFGTIHAWRAAILFLSPLVWNVYVYMFHEEWWVLAWTWWKFHNAHTTFCTLQHLQEHPKKIEPVQFNDVLDLDVTWCYHVFIYVPHFYPLVAHPVPMSTLEQTRGRKGGCKEATWKGHWNWDETRAGKRSFINNKSGTYNELIQPKSWSRIRKLEAQGPWNSYCLMQANFHHNRSRVLQILKAFLLMYSYVLYALRNLERAKAR